MTTTKPERIEFNPQKGILNMMIEASNSRKQQPHHVGY